MCICEGAGTCLTCLIAKKLKEKQSSGWTEEEIIRHYFGSVGWEYFLGRG